MDLPVADVDAAAPFYQKVFGFRLEPSSGGDPPVKKAELVRDEIRIGLAENGGDPEQDGCAFEVDDVAAAHAELRSNGLEKIGEIKAEKREDGSRWRAFFVIAPDGLCFWIGEKSQA